MAPHDERCVEVGLIREVREQKARNLSILENGKNVVSRERAFILRNTVADLDSLISQAHECDGGLREALEGLIAAAGWRRQQHDPSDPMWHGGTDRSRECLDCALFIARTALSDTRLTG